MAETSGKGKKRQSYTIQFKKDVVSYAVNHSNRAAASKFNIEPKRVREWRSVAEKFNTVKVNRKRLDGVGRNCLDEELEEEVPCWVYSMRQKMLHVSPKMIIFKAKKIFDDKTTDPASRDTSVASRVWCEKFMRRHGFSLWQKTTTAQKDPPYLTDWLVSFVMHARPLQHQYNFVPHNIAVGNDKLLSGTIWFLKLLLKLLVLKMSQ